MRPMVSLPYSGLQDGNVSEMGDVRIVLASDDEVVVCVLRCARRDLIYF